MFPLLNRWWTAALLGTALLFGAGPARAQQSGPHVSTGSEAWKPADLGAPLARDPIFVYNNWSSYDELSDNIPLTEELAMRELHELLRLRKDGVRFDYYMMDAFWFAPDGGYRKWRTPNWPDGPDRWIAECRRNGVQPGLWFSSNTLVKIDAAPQWRNSLNGKGTAMSFYEGGFLPDFMSTLDYWYEHGIRMFKFDFVDLTAATPKAEASQSKEEIQRRNADALRRALGDFRRRHPDVVLEAFNGFGGDMDMTSTALPFRQPVDLRWLEVFDAQYSGDPRPSDVPEMNFWRSMDIYSDHMVRQYERSGLPLNRIDSTGFMIGKTGTIYYRGMHAWKGAFLLMMARGGWINTVHGNLELMGDEDARWMARAQSLFLRFQSVGQIKTFGGIPGESQPYGFGAMDSDGAVYTVVNPAQAEESIRLPLLSREQGGQASGRILFRDAGYRPQLTGRSIRLGAGQMAVVGFGKYAGLDLGVQSDVVIPESIEPVAAEFSPAQKGEITATLSAPRGRDLRLVMQQYSPDGTVRRTWAGGPPSGENMSRVFLLEATQNGKALPVHIDYDKIVWSGLSWAVGEIRRADIDPQQPIQLRFTSKEKDPVELRGKVFAIR